MARKKFSFKVIFETPLEEVDKNNDPDKLKQMLGDWRDAKDRAYLEYTGVNPKIEREGDHEKLLRVRRFGRGLRDYE